MERGSLVIELASVRAERDELRSRFSSVTQSLGEGLLVLSGNGCLETSNPAAHRFLGLTHEQLRARGSLDPLAGAIGSSRKCIAAEDLPATVALQMRTPVRDVTLGLRSSDGILRWFVVDAYPMMDSGHRAPYGVVVLMHDVTAARADLERTRFQSALLESAGRAIVASDLDGTITYWNNAAEALYGWSAAEALGQNVIMITPSPQSDAEGFQIFAELAAGKSWTGGFTMRHRNGATFPVIATNTPVFDDDGNLKAIVAISHDDTDRQRSEQTVRELSAIVESSSEAIVGVSLDGMITSWNKGAERLYGYNAVEVTGRPTSILAPSIVIEREQAEATGRLLRGESVVGQETLRRRKDGTVIDVSLTASPICADDGSVVGFSAIVRDECARKQAERALRHQALHDDLTGLPNRTLLDDRLRQALGRAKRSDGNVAVLFLDLDDFKLVNDALGHLAGDEILVQVGTRIREILRPQDTVARFGGDEFVIICEVSGTGAALDISDRLREAIEAPLVLECTGLDEDLGLTASIGLVIADDGATPEGLLRDADTAMYCAKGRGPSSVELFDPTMRQSATSRLATSSALRRALARDELRVFYQPIVSVDDVRPLAVEALIRWRHPERGLVQPDEFIPLAELSGLIVPIGRWVLREALRDRARWQAAMPRHAPLRLAVNLSAVQLRDPALVDDVAAALSEFGSSPESLILEVTETVLMTDAAAPRTLRALRDMGISLHIDDFGTGYSSLAYIRELPVDTLKIDREFVKGLGSDDQHGYLVATMISLAEALSLEVIAEGVETEMQLNVLRDMRCQNAQGFLFARPMPYADLVAWLADQRSPDQE